MKTWTGRYRGSGRPAVARSGVTGPGASVSRGRARRSATGGSRGAIPLRGRTSNPSFPLVAIAPAGRRKQDSEQRATRRTCRRVMTDAFDASARAGARGGRFERPGEAGAAREPAPGALQPVEAAGRSRRPHRSN
ncbi:hypothetical protein GCM10027075_25590 [Streptomyces heilongjiangensis]